MQRRKRDRRIRLALEIGIPVSMIVATMHVSTGTVSRVAEKTPRRRKVHKLSQRAWAHKLPPGAGRHPAVPEETTG